MTDSVGSMAEELHRMLHIINECRGILKIYRSEMDKISRQRNAHGTGTGNGALPGARIKSERGGSSKRLRERRLELQ